jgi:hypothetical protein
MKRCGTKKKLPTDRNSFQDFANFRDSAILRFIDNCCRELPLLLLGVLQKCSELFDRNKSYLGVIEAKPIQVAPESRNEIGSRGNQRRFSRLGSQRFCGQDCLKRFSGPGTIMDQKSGLTEGIFGCIWIEQTAQSQIDTVPDRRVLPSAQTLQQPPFFFCCDGNTREVVFPPFWNASIR